MGEVMRWVVLMLMMCVGLFGDENIPIQIAPVSDEALRLYRTGNVLWIVQQIFPMALFALVIFSGFSTTMRNWSKRCTRRWVGQVALYVIFLGIFLFLANLPLSYYAEYVRPHEYGLSSQSLPKWLSDTLISTVISLVVGCLVTLVVYGLMRKSPKRWWLYCSFLTLPFIVLAVLVTPLWIEPLFNKFGPMKNKELEAKILHLADCAGIEGGRVYEVDKSQDTSMLNAYVTGFGNTKRIVLWDTIIHKLTTKELLFVMGHEMGHFVLHHIEKDILFQFALSIVLFLFLSTAVQFIRRNKKALHMESISDIASLPLLLLMAQLFFFLTGPISNAFSRHLEHEADCFGLEITQDSGAAASAFVKLQEENLAHPTPGALFVFWRASHPPLGERVNYCNTYHPWKEGKPLQFQKYIKPDCY
jgi:STE24 endopeptidase